MKDNNLPEEKLLTLIRKSDDLAAQGLIDKKSVLAGASRRVKRIREYFARGEWLARVIIFSFILSLAFFLLSWISAYLPFNSRTETPADGRGSREMTVPKIPVLPLESYLEEINKKDIFYSSYSKKYDPRDISLDAVKNIALVGIIRDEPMQAVIKDKKSGDVFYLKKGERVGEFTLMDIQEGKVVIEYRGEMFEIYL